LEFVSLSTTMGIMMSRVIISTCSHQPFHLNLNEIFKCLLAQSNFLISKIALILTNGLKKVWSFTIKSN